MSPVSLSGAIPDPISDPLYSTTDTAGPAPAAADLPSFAPASAGAVPVSPAGTGPVPADPGTAGPRAAALPESGGAAPPDAFAFVTDPGGDLAPVQPGPVPAGDLPAPAPELAFGGGPGAGAGPAPDAGESPGAGPAPDAGPAPGPEAPPEGGIVIEVADAAGLSAALAAAQGGETILLAAGDYGHLSTGRDFASTVTLKAAVPGTVEMSGAMLRGVTNLTLDGIHFDYSHTAGEPASEVMVWIRNGTNVTLRNCSFTGDDMVSDDPVLDGSAAGFGLRVRGSEGVTVEGGSLTTLWKGIHVLDSRDIVIRDVEISDFRSDALNLVNVQDALIEDNYLHSARRAYGSGDHPDMIQMWTKTDDPEMVSRDVTIRGNVLDKGEGGWTQGIFITNVPVDREGAPDDFLLRNILIEDNVLINGHINGLRVGATDGLTIRNNTLLFEKDMADPGALNNRAQDTIAIVVSGNARNVEISGNTVPRIVGADGQPDWRLSDNVEPGSDAAMTRSIERLRDNGYELGAAEIQARPEVQVASAAGQVLFDGRGSDDGGAPGIDPGTRFAWDFGDGTVAEGALQEHRYAAGGHYTVSLTMTVDGTDHTASRAVAVAGPDMLHLDPATGLLVTTGYGRVTGQIDDLEVLRLTDNSLALRLDGAAHDLGGGHLDTLAGAEGLRLALSLQGGPGAGGGQVIDLGGVLRVATTAAGELRLELTTDRGPEPVVLETDDADLGARRWNSVELLYDGTSLRVAVNGEMRGVTAAEGLLPAPGALVIGGGHAGAIRHLDLDVADHDSPPLGPEALALVLDSIGDLVGSSSLTLHGGATLVDDDGDGDLDLRLSEDGWAGLGVLDGTATSSDLAVSLRFSFSRDDDSGRAMIFESPKRLSADLVGDRLKISVATADGRMERAFTNDLSELLTEGRIHELTVWAETDRLRATVDGIEVLAREGLNMDLAGAGRDFGWSLGSRWNSSTMDLEIEEFRIADFSHQPDLAVPVDVLAL